MHGVTGLELTEEYKELEKVQSIRDKLKDKEKQLDGSQAVKEEEKNMIMMEIMM